jgi:hypothetical protein
VSVYTAIHPLGPWEKQNQIGFSSHCPQISKTSRLSTILLGSSSPSDAHCNSSDFFTTTSVGAQQSDVFPWRDSEGVLQYMYVNYNCSCSSFLTFLLSCTMEIAGSHPPMGSSLTTSLTFTLWHLQLTEI